MKYSITRYLLSILTLLTLASCQTIDVRGQYVDEAAIAQLESKKMTKAEVVELIGTPTMVPTYSQNSWYYIQRALSRRAWFQPKVIEQKIVKVTFGANDAVEEVQVLSNMNNEDVKVVSEYTKTYGTELNGVQKFVKNIGRFNKTTDGKKRNRK